MNTTTRRRQILIWHYVEKRYIDPEGEASGDWIFVEKFQNGEAAYGFMCTVEQNSNPDFVQFRTREVRA